MGSGAGYGYSSHAFDFVTTLYGDRSARARDGAISVLTTEGWRLGDATPPDPSGERGARSKQLPLLPYTSVAEECWLKSHEWGAVPARFVDLTPSPSAPAAPVLTGSVVVVLCISCLMLALRLRPLADETRQASSC